MTTNELREAAQRAAHILDVITDRCELGAYQTDAEDACGGLRAALTATTNEAAAQAEGDVCRSCAGSGEVEGMGGQGPDTYSVTVPCGTCGGTGDPAPAVDRGLSEAQCSKHKAGTCCAYDKLLCEVFKDKAVVEQRLFDAANGKTPMPDAQQLHELALLLGHSGPLLSEHVAASAPSQAERIAELEAELDDKDAEIEEARRAPWPEWAETILKLCRDVSGYDGYDDADGVDLVEEVRENFAELQAEIERLKAKAPSQAEPAPDERMFRAAISDLAAVAAELRLDPDDGGAEPIIDAIRELRAAAVSPTVPPSQAEPVQVNANLMTVVEHILDEGHLNTEGLGRLREAWEASTPSQAGSCQASEFSDDDYAALTRAADAFDKIASGVCQTTDYRLFAKTTPRKMTINDAKAIAECFGDGLRKVRDRLYAAQPAGRTLTDAPEIDYDVLIKAGFDLYRYRQGSGVCVAFARGAEWYRQQVLEPAILAASGTTAVERG